MKNLRLIIILSVFSVIALLVVLCSTVFTFNTVSFAWVAVSEGNINLPTNENILQNAGIETKGSIFLLNKQEIVNSIELANPYLKVENAQVVFPNKLELIVSERYEFYALEVTNSNADDGKSYVYLDDELKVLKIVNAIAEDASSFPILLTQTGLDLNIDQFTAGEFATELPTTTLSYIVSILMQMDGYDAKTAVAFLKSVNFVYASTCTLTLETAKGNIINIYDAESSTFAKLVVAYSTHEDIRKIDDRITEAHINVFIDNATGDLLAEWVDGEDILIALGYNPNDFDSDYFS